MREAEEYPGPSLILAYSHCIAHGYDLRDGLKQQKLATLSGYWPLVRYNPALRNVGRKPFVLDSPRPSIPLEDYAYNEMRYKVLMKTDPEQAAVLMRGAQELVERTSMIENNPLHAKVEGAEHLDQLFGRNRLRKPAAVGLGDPHGRLRLRGRQWR